MITRTFIEKSTTIYKDSDDNYGLYPVGMLCYGNNISRALIYFDESNIREKIVDRTFADTSKLKHILNLKNCGDIDKRNSKKILCKGNDKEVIRATSFDVIVFRIPREWDEGDGFDSSNDFWFSGRGKVSHNACNWYQSSNGNLWDNTLGCDEGIYNSSTLSREYTKFAEGLPSIVVARQHFDYGNENFEIDITGYVNDILAGKYKNNGLCLAFSPLIEDSELDITHYVGFFTNNTNTIFHPYVESRYDDFIDDDRYAFYLNKKNKLYLYASINGELSNLDETPSCTIEGLNEELTVKQASKGVYYVDIKIDNGVIKPDTIMYDIWSNLKYRGDTIDDVEMEFVTLKPQSYFSVGENIQTKNRLDVVISGINDSEKINQGDKRMVKTIFKVPYTHNDYEITENAKYRIYVKDGASELDIVKWDYIEKANRYNYFIVDTKTLLPAEYFVDVMLPYGNETRIFKGCLKFKIVNNKSGLKI